MTNKVRPNTFIPVSLWFEASCWDRSRGRYKPIGLAYHSEEIELLFKLATKIVGSDDEVTSITIRGRSSITGEYFQVTIRRR